MTDPPDCEPGGEMSAATIAARERRTPDEVAYDYLPTFMLLRTQAAA